MRVFVHTTLSPQTGMGHAVRCRALAQALAAQGAEVIILFGPESVKPGHCACCPDSTLLEAFMAPFPCRPNLAGIVTFATGDTVVLDVQDFQGRAEDLPLLRQRGVRLVRLDHPHAAPETADLLVAPGAHWDAATVDRLRADFGERFLYGFDYVMLDPVVTSQPPLPYTQPRGEHDARASRQDGLVVFCAGGSDPTGALEQMDTWLASASLDAGKVFCVGRYASGTLATLLKARREVALGNDTWLHPFQPGFLQHAALVVGMMGMTVYECLYYGTPMLCFAREPADVERLEVLSDATHGAVIACGLFGAYTQERFCRLVQHYAGDPARLQRMAAASAGLIDGLGTQRVANAILGLT